MTQKFDSLTYHGKTVSQCEWVLMTYGGREDYINNQSVQQWLADSQAFLDAYYEDQRFDKAVESKFGADQVHK